MSSDEQFLLCCAKVWWFLKNNFIRGFPLDCNNQSNYLEIHNHPTQTSSRVSAMQRNSVSSIPNQHRTYLIEIREFSLLKTSISLDILLHFSLSPMWVVVESSIFKAVMPLSVLFAIEYSFQSIFIQETINKFLLIQTKQSNHFLEMHTFAFLWRNFLYKLSERRTWRHLWHKPPKIQRF